VVRRAGKSYDAWVRFSNATGVVTADYDTAHDTNTGATTHTATSRGMAIKLMGVEGATLFDEPRAKTQDFLLINQPMFGFGDVATYLKVTQLQLQFKDKQCSDLRRPVRQDPASDHRADEPARHRQDRGDPRAHRRRQNEQSTRWPVFFGLALSVWKRHAAKFSVTRRDPENRPIDEFPSDNACVRR